MPTNGDTGPQLRRAHQLNRNVRDPQRTHGGGVTGPPGQQAKQVCAPAKAAGVAWQTVHLARRIGSPCPLYRSTGVAHLDPARAARAARDWLAAAGADGEILEATPEHVTVTVHRLHRTQLPHLVGVGELHASATATALQGISREFAISEAASAGNRSGGPV